MKHKVTKRRLFLTRLPSLKNKKKIMIIAFVGIIAFAGCTKKPVVVVKPDPIVETVPNPEDYVKEPVGIVTIEATGEKVDLAKLKQKYGNLYRLVEPMTDKEIDDQYFAIITVLHQINIRNKLSRINVPNDQVTPWIGFCGYMQPNTEEEFRKYVDVTSPLFNKIEKAAATSKDPVISAKFSYYFIPVGNGVYSFSYSEEMLKSMDTGEIGTISKFDKEFFVRYYKIGMDIERQVRKEQGLDLTQQFKNAVPMIVDVDLETKIK